MTLIVDASVALKWFVSEEQSEAAYKLLDASEPLSAPELIVVEMANAVWRKAIQGRIPFLQAEAVVTAMSYGEVALIPSVDLAEAALEIALALKHPVYDCFYLACAQRLNGVLITADDRLCKAVEDSAFAALVRPLRAMPDRPS